MTLKEDYMELGSTLLVTLFAWRWGLGGTWQWEEWMLASGRQNDKGCSLGRWFLVV